MPSHHGAPNHVVILGGGVTGLSAAFHLARKHPTVQITLVERSTRFGGWVRSERVQVADGDGNRGSVLLEAGPRTVRPNAKYIIELIRLLDLRSEVIYTPRGSPAARNRFLHVPPARGLQPLPSGPLSLFTLPLGRLVLGSVLAEPFVPANRPGKTPPPPPPPLPPAPSAQTARGTVIPTTTTTTTTTTTGAVQEDVDDDDESVDTFLSRRFGEAFARTLGSALVHGIYAADSRLLSVRAAFPALRASEARGNGSVVWGELGPPAWFGWRAAEARAELSTREEGGGEDDDDDDDEGEDATSVDREWEARFRANAALFSFREGMETLVHALVRALRGFPNVTLRSGTAARGVETVNDGDDLFFHIYLDTKRGEDDDADADAAVPAPATLRAAHVISALPLSVLDSILQPSAASARARAQTLPHLRANPLSSVTVLNLVFPSAPSGSTGTKATTSPPQLHPPGFGYLIPRPRQGYGRSLRVPSEPAPEGPGTGSGSGSEPEGGGEGEDPEPGLLGVVFDTAGLPEQDSGQDSGEGPSAGAGTARFTKMTAMLGGPYDVGSTRELLSSDARLVEVVLRRISAHLGHPLPRPAHYAVHRNEESIPMYVVGHTARMRQLERALRERWGGRMKVVGAGVGGVSVADCVKAGRQAAYDVGTQIKN
ncbi:hypothetical protein F5148DRAFT_605035 [Russula earlei]|uniref:Uncharacterized protein n=1 Tax=Russula earlei TaxID=71964 RepID=A0ACC0UGB7_9AGAM|nr:hypothetical protein F5148DRAFT_605035 [Russula earlei]